MILGSLYRLENKTARYKPNKDNMMTTVFLKSLHSSLLSVLSISLSYLFSFTFCVYFFCSSLLSMSSIVCSLIPYAEVVFPNYI